MMMRPALLFPVPMRNGMIPGVMSGGGVRTMAVILTGPTDLTEALTLTEEATRKARNLRPADRKEDDKADEKTDFAQWHQLGWEGS